MKAYKVLVLTDHGKHTSENSLYPLVAKMAAHNKTSEIHVASRVNPSNKKFFSSLPDAPLYVTPVNKEFNFIEESNLLEHNLVAADLDTYDLIWLRMPPPLSRTFLNYIEKRFDQQCVINRPSGILETGSKQFLLNFKEVCPPMQICHRLEDIVTFKIRFPIVLKPLRAYGGKGILKIVGDKVYQGSEEISFEDFARSYVTKKEPYLAVKYLKNVAEGDKRIVVVNGKVMGASLRLPAEGSWLCNVAMGGSSHITTVEEEEYKIVEMINETLVHKGIVMYGVDTLVDDDGRRILSEINTTSIGGLPQIAQLQNKPLVEESVDLIWQYFEVQKEIK